MTFVSAFVFLFQTAVKAQPDYSFKNAVLVSGSGLQTGAKYKFSNVRTNVDAFITIIAQTGGIRLTEMDIKTTGYDEAFQPSIYMEKNSGGYVEFQLDFVDAGTGEPKVQNNIPVSCINVDGDTFNDGNLYEQSQVQFFPGYYDYSNMGSKIQITLPAGWIIINNTSGLRYAGIDTTARELMATVVNKGISSFLLRIGGTNNSQTNSVIRNRSIYFKSFNYGHLNTLPNRTMLSLSGSKKQNGVELKGLLSSSHSYNKLIIERAASNGVFGVISEMDISGTTASIFAFTYLDTKPENGVNYYRIRLLNAATNIQEISNSLMVKMDNNQKDLEVINTLVQGSHPVLSIRSIEDNDADFQVSDMSGRILYNTKTRINNGFNNINLAGFNTARGYFVLVVKTKNNTISQRILVQ